MLIVTVNLAELRVEGNRGGKRACHMTSRRHAPGRVARKGLLCHKVSMTPTAYHMWQCFVAVHQDIVPLWGGQSNA